VRTLVSRLLAQWALAGRDTGVALELVSGDEATLTPIRQATVPF
jgi:hypothetical protein